jgi:hypothetical protein
MRQVVLDTGPLVAVLDPRDARHQRAARVFPSVVTRCVTTEAVVTEACHLAGRGRGDLARPLEFLLAAGIPIVSLDPGAHRQAVHLMRRYHAVPMDYADATLVVLADVLGAATAFSFDVRGFSVYRGGAGAAFTLVD